ncbi:MAG: hypothetical protein MUE53_09415 [Chitinophagales bacterium]|jgi:tetratricopeptide (TPR) repeat protein|nr:hypothetical protein [Chitinophagales bacterium]
MKHIKLILSIFVLSISILSFSQKKGAEPVIDPKKMAEANTLISKAISEKSSEKKNDMLRKATELFREMKMSKEGATIIGDAFYANGDMKNAVKWYSKGDKADKLDNLEKIGETYLENALEMEEGKEKEKEIKNALKFLSKKHGAPEANRIVGNKYFDMGESGYPQAISYFQVAGYKEGIMLIADKYKSSGNLDKAAEVYGVAGTREAFEKAGNMYYDRGQYIKAMEFYRQGGVIEGYMKYASELKKAGKIPQANIVYNIISDTLKSRGKIEDMRDVAVEAEREKNYELASLLYNKLDDQDLSKKYYAYSQLMKMEIVEARKVFQDMGRDDLVSSIDNNISTLTNLQQYDLVLRELEKNVPKLGEIEDPSGKGVKYDPRDIKLREQFYANPMNVKSISETVYKIGKEFQGFKEDNDIKTLVKERFLIHKPVKRLLNPETFKNNIEPAKVTSADIVF